MRNTGTLKVTTPTDREIVMTRVFDAPRHLVFAALTKPELLKRWLFGPPGWSLAVCEIDLKVGGTYRYVWRGPDGTEMGMGGVYREIVSPERLVATEAFDDPWYPGEAVGTIVLIERGGKTTLTNTVLYASREARDIALSSNMEHGMAVGYDRLAELLESGVAQGEMTMSDHNTRDLIVTRTFDAPIGQVWNAWTDPKYVMQWWGPDGFTSPVAKMDVRAGGTSLVCMRSPEGQDLYSTWEYKKIVPMQRIEYIHNLADKDGNKDRPCHGRHPPGFPAGCVHRRNLQSRGRLEGSSPRFRLPRSFIVAR